MLEDHNPTTRCYPRTLAEAFPESIDRAEWFYPPEENNGWRNIAHGLCGAGDVGRLGLLLFKELRKKCHYMTTQQTQINGSTSHRNTNSKYSPSNQSGNAIYGATDPAA